MAHDNLYNSLAQHFIGLRADELLRNKDNYPIYDVYQYSHGSNKFFQIDVAVAGFTKDDLEVTVNQGILTISANDNKSVERENITFIKRSIAKRKFQITFKIEKHIVVDNVKLEHGILAVILREELPEEQVPKKIPIM